MQGDGHGMHVRRLRPLVQRHPSARCDFQRVEIDLLLFLRFVERHQTGEVNITVAKPEVRLVREGENATEVRTNAGFFEDLAFSAGFDRFA